MFEAVHGSAPDIAGQGHRQPVGAAAGLRRRCCVHIGQARGRRARPERLAARRSRDGIHTADITGEGLGGREVGTEAFAAGGHRAARGTAAQLTPVDVPRRRHLGPTVARPRPATKELVGVDVFLDWSEDGRDPDVARAGGSRRPCRRLAR